VVAEVVVGKGPGHRGKRAAAVRGIIKRTKDIKDTKRIKDIKHIKRIKRMANDDRVHRDKVEVADVMAIHKIEIATLTHKIEMGTHIATAMATLKMVTFKIEIAMHKIAMIMGRFKNIGMRRENFTKILIETLIEKHIKMPIEKCLVINIGISIGINIGIPEITET
jgi:hypothetical protein